MLTLRESFRNITDEIIWERYREGNEAAFNEIFLRYYQRILHYGLKFWPDQLLVEDCIQELMIRIWQKRNVVNRTESVKFYLLKTFRHILFRKLKQNRVFSEKTEEDRLQEVSVEDQFIREETHEVLKNKVKVLLSQLTPRQQEVLYLRFYQNLSPGEIAELLQINTQSVCNIIHRAFQKIRETTPISNHNNFIFSIIQFFL